MQAWATAAEWASVCNPLFILRAVCTSIHASVVRCLDSCLHCAYNGPVQPPCGDGMAWASVRGIYSLVAKTATETLQTVELTT